MSYQVNLNYFKESGIKYKVSYLDADNITEKTLEYAKKVDANLISIMTEQETRGKYKETIRYLPGLAFKINNSPGPFSSHHLTQ